MIKDTPHFPLYTKEKFLPRSIHYIRGPKDFFTKKITFYHENESVLPFSDIVEYRITRGLGYRKKLNENVEIS